jgi:hypothetical protein
MAEPACIGRVCASGFQFGVAKLLHVLGRQCEVSGQERVSKLRAYGCEANTALTWQLIIFCLSYNMNHSNTF